MRKQEITKVDVKNGLYEVIASVDVDKKTSEFWKQVYKIWELLEITLKIGVSELETALVKVNWNEKNVVVPYEYISNWVCSTGIDFVRFDNGNYGLIDTSVNYFNYIEILQVIM